MGQGYLNHPLLSIKFIRSRLHCCKTRTEQTTIHECVCQIRSLIARPRQLPAAGYSPHSIYQRACLASRPPDPEEEESFCRSGSGGAIDRRGIQSIVHRYSRP